MSEACPAEAWIALASARGVGPALFRRLLTRFNTPAAVLAAGERDLCEVEGIGPATARAIRDAGGEEALRRAADALARAAECDARLVVLHDDDYPLHLRGLADAPPYLFVLGDLSRCRGLVLAVVGAREPTDYGRQMTTAICAELARQGWAVASGMAHGIDTTAHFAALDVGGASVGVAGCGVAHLPVETFPSVKRLLAEGAVVSEFHPTRPALTGSFQTRNRIIAGMALGTLVVEAGTQSGALITAECAMRAGRPVFAVPGKTTDPTSSGANALIKRGARLVDSPGDILAVFQNEVARFGGSSTMSASEKRAPVVRAAQPAPAKCDAGTGRSPDEQAVMAALAGQPVDVDTLLRKTTLTPAALATAMLRLEMDGHLVRLPGNRVALRR